MQTGGAQTEHRAPSEWEEAFHASACARAINLQRRARKPFADGPSTCGIEVNGNPHRLDLAPPWLRKASRRGIRLVVSSDAHSTTGLANVRFGIDMARRGWIHRSEVLNTLPPDRFADAVRPSSSPAWSAVADTVVRGRASTLVAGLTPGNQMLKALHTSVKPGSGGGVKASSSAIVLGTAAARLTAGGRA